MMDHPVILLLLTWMPASRSRQWTEACSCSSTNSSSSTSSSSTNSTWRQCSCRQQDGQVQPCPVWSQRPAMQQQAGAVMLHHVPPARQPASAWHLLSHCDRWSCRLQPNAAAQQQANCRSGRAQPLPAACGATCPPTSPTCCQGFAGKQGGGPRCILPQHQPGGLPHPHWQRRWQLAARRCR